MLAGILRRDANDALDTAEKLKEGPLDMAKDFEWDHFVTNNNSMVDPRNPVRQVSHVTYPGKEHPAAIEVRAGMLERKSKYLKNYTPGWSVDLFHLHLNADIGIGMSSRRPTCMNSNLRIVSHINLRSCLSTYQSRSSALIPIRVPRLTNSC